MTVFGQNDSKAFYFNQISKADFKSALENNFNATSSQLFDSTKIEMALQLIDKTYTQEEIELADNELCLSPRCLISFYGYYPKLDILVFKIQDYHYENAVFLKNNDHFPKTWINRFKGSFGVLSKTGIWVGLERQDADNYLKMEVAQITDRGVFTILEFGFRDIDINDIAEKPIFWADENTLYLATIEFEENKKEGLEKFYEIRFDY